MLDSTRRRGLSLLLPIIAAITAATITAVTGCSVPRVRDFNPSAEPSSTVVFGVLKVIRDGKNLTARTTIAFSNNESLKVDADGLIAAHIAPEQNGMIKITKITLDDNGADYDLSNIAIKAGRAGVKTYFGHVVVKITLTDAKQGEFFESWSWSVDNQWKEAHMIWNKIFGSDKEKGKPSFEIALAERKGMNRTQTRAVASERSDVITGF